MDEGLRRAAAITGMIAFGLAGGLALAAGADPLFAVLRGIASALALTLPLLFAGRGLIAWIQASGETAEEPDPPHAGTALNSEPSSRDA